MTSECEGRFSAYIPDVFFEATLGIFDIIVEGCGQRIRCPRERARAPAPVAGMLLGVICGGVVLDHLERRLGMCLSELRARCLWRDGKVCLPLALGRTRR